MKKKPQKQKQTRNGVSLSAVYIHVASQLDMDNKGQWKTNLYHKMGDWFCCDSLLWIFRLCAAPFQQSMCFLAISIYLIEDCSWRESFSTEDFWWRVFDISGCHYEVTKPHFFQMSIDIFPLWPPFSPLYWLLPYNQLCLTEFDNRVTRRMP